MTLPVTIGVSINFSDGPQYAQALLLDTGILDTNVLANNAALIVDYSTQSTQIAIRRGRDLINDVYNTGSATVKILDPAGDFNPSNTLSPIYGFVKPLRKIQITATYSSTTYNLFSGYISEYRYSYPTGQETGFVTVSAFDAFKIFNLATISTVTGATAGQDTGTRIDKILDEISWPNSMRSISIGDTPCIADTGASRTALAAIRIAEFSELGALFIDPQGNAVFKSRTETIETAGGTPTVFNQTGGIPYANLKFALDDKLIINSANITRAGGTMQSHTDTDSVDTYFLHSVNSSNLIMQTDAIALDVAQLYVASRSQTDLRIDSMTLDLMSPSYSAGITAALSMDYFSPVTISNIQPNGDTITRTLQIQGVSHDITPNTFVSTFTTMEPITDGFLLDSTFWGILDTSVLSY